MSSDHSSDSEPKSAVSERKRAANRANAQKSTGPKTAEGKVRSAANARLRGLFVERLLVDVPCLDESSGALSTLRMRWHGELRPETEIEFDLVDQIVAAHWEARRLREVDGIVLQGLEKEKGLQGLIDYQRGVAARQAAIAGHLRQARQLMKELEHRQRLRLNGPPRWDRVGAQGNFPVLISEPVGYVGSGPLPEFRMADLTATKPVEPPVPPPLEFSVDWDDAPRSRSNARPAKREPELQAPPPRSGRDMTLEEAMAPFAGMSDDEIHAKLNAADPLPPGYRYTSKGIVHVDDADPFKSRLSSAARAQKFPHKFGYPRPYPGQPAWGPFPGDPAVSSATNVSSATPTSVSSGGVSPANGHGAGTGNGFDGAYPGPNGSNGHHADLFLADSGGVMVTYSPYFFRRED